MPSAWAFYISDIIVIYITLHTQAHISCFSRTSSQNPLMCSDLMCEVIHNSTVRS